ncbi:MAG TPA: hypothetical protein DCX08_00205 [Porticoccaceae bacterium]|jgi:flagellar basal-body rod modification protein FlgD|nr:hypothetical protein [Porticoccaceae bacterium]
MVDTLTTSSFLTSAQYADQQMSTAAEDDLLGRDAFLQLLTTQLTNQDPLDPMDNEAFVAQLAQFSSVEGIKGMQTSLESMSSAMRQDQMIAGANLMGKGVLVPGGAFANAGGQQAEGVAKLDFGAEALLLDIHDQDTGELIYSENLGSRGPGNHDLSWNGRTNTGDVAPKGNYIMSANVALNGEVKGAPVSTVSQVKSVKWDANLQELTLEINDGKYVSLSQVERISAYYLNTDY